MADKDTYVLKFDGACKGNPGASGGGAIMYRVDDTGAQHEIFRCGVYIPHATNNQAEYAGLIAGLKHAKKYGIKQLTIVGDSQLVVRQITGRYRVNSPNLIAQYTEAKKLMENFEARVTHVLRHFNSDADAVANSVVLNRADLCVSTQFGASEVCMACPTQ